jgi:hypothetical protein
MAIRTSNKGRPPEGVTRARSNRGQRKHSERFKSLQKAKKLIAERHSVSRRGSTRRKKNDSVAVEAIAWCCIGIILMIWFVIEWLWSAVTRRASHRE